MMKNLELLESCYKLFAKIDANHYQVEYPPFEGAVTVAPKGHDINAKIDFCLMGITHGNEVVGLDICHYFLEKLANCSLKIDFKFALVLGNVLACGQDKRILFSEMS